MRRRKKQNGFSLTEVLLATGILAIGFVLIAMIFPAGIKLTSMAAEKTLGPAIAEEAAAKMRLAGLDLSRIDLANINTFYLFPGQRPVPVTDNPPLRHLDPQSEKYLYKKLILPTLDLADPAADLIISNNANLLYTTIAKDFLNKEGIYPSVPASHNEPSPTQSMRYSWSAIYRGRGSIVSKQDIQAMIFVCRTSGNKPYYGVLYDAVERRYVPVPNLKFPVPVPVYVTLTASNQLTIASSAVNTFFQPNEYKEFFRVGTELVDDKNGDVYKVIEMLSNGDLRIDKNWQDMSPSANPFIWVVPPAVGSQRNPCIGIYQAVLN